jgi:hypothetical protein
MAKEDIARRAELAREGRYRSQTETADVERKLKVAEHFRDQLPSVLSSADPAAAWSKWQGAAKAALGDTFSAPEQYPGEEAARGYMMKANDAIKSAQEQLQVMAGPGGAPVLVNKKTGTFQMGTEAGTRAPGAPAAAGAPAAGFDMNRAKQAIAGIESGGKYDALGPITRNGDRAFGKYQVMGANIPAWTKEALGQSMTPAEFLADPEAQERVFETQFGKNVAKYGNPADAASVWFSGRPLAKAGNAADVLGTTVPQYAQKFMAAYEGGANTPANMRAPGFASSTGIPANVGLPVQPVLNALAGAQPQPPVNALATPPQMAMAPPQMTMAPQPQLTLFQQAQAAAEKRDLEKKTAETLATERAKAQVKAESTETDRRTSAKQVLNLVSDPGIEKLIKSSTSGRLQSGAAAVSEAFTGESTPGMVNIGKLDTLAKKMLFDLANGKLGGGFSNEDRKSIEGMLGNIADPNIGANRRVAALKQLREMMRSMATGEPMTVVPTEAPAAKGGPSVDELLKKYAK